ncbi:MAG: segregation/condensation protein A [Proteobacteria bacterium]|nr:segregation/condensation protein A [Pseudomonadota bacterium]
MSLTVKLEIYEGPLDLLLHLIKKNEVDIYDIPVALITSQYLDYLDLLESLNVEVAGEFLVMAATLAQIKSRLLLPILDSDEESEEEDPRMAIVRPLLEYIRVKEAAESLERRNVLDRDVFARQIPLPEPEVPPGEEMLEANLFDLIDAFRSIASRIESSAGLQFILETKTIQERITEIIQLLKEKQQATFEDICAQDTTKAQLVLSFLAILELARVGILRLFQHHATRVLTAYYMEKSSLFQVVEPQTPESENGAEAEE